MSTLEPTSRVALYERLEPGVAGGVRIEQLVERNSALTFWDGLSGHAKPLRYWAGRASQKIRCYLSSVSVERVEDAAGFEDPVSESEQFAHCSGNDGHLRLSAGA